MKPHPQTPIIDARTAALLLALAFLPLAVLKGCSEEILWASNLSETDVHGCMPCRAASEHGHRVGSSRRIWHPGSSPGSSIILSSGVEGHAINTRVANGGAIWEWHPVSRNQSRPTQTFPSPNSRFSVAAQPMEPSGSGGGLLMDEATAKDWPYFLEVMWAA